MTWHSRIRSGLEPLIGARRLARMGRAERRWRSRLAARIDPAPSPPINYSNAPVERRDKAEAALRRSEHSPQPRQTYATPTLSRHAFLSALHQHLQPRTYLEIGVSDGRSLALSRVPSIGVDPAFKVTAPIACDVRLVRATSDEFFDSSDPAAHFGGTPIDLAFIDGLHLAEFAYRDFMNVE